MMRSEFKFYDYLGATMWLLRVSMVFFFVFAGGVAGCGAESNSNGTNQESVAEQNEVSLPDGVEMERVELPGGIGIEVPTTWRILSRNESDAIVKWSDAALGSDSGNKVTLYRANSTPLATYASVAITANQPDPSMPIWALEAAINEDPTEIDEIMREELQQMLSAINQRLSAYRGVRTLRIGGNAAYIVDYDRTGIEGDVRVQLLRVQDGDVEYAVNFGYRLSESEQWESVIDYMLNSIDFN